MFPPRLNLPGWKGFSLILWLVLAQIVWLGESSQDPKRAQQVLEIQAKDSHHLKEHLMEQMGMDEEAATKYLNETKSEVQFFLMHDYDNNSKLDGLELFQGLSHHEHSQEEGHQETAAIPENDLATFVDTILEDQDRNDDGYIDYPEFVISFRQQSGHTGGS
ncbi:hypothetical protein ACROYT_G016291 [Oculina patagonica]